MKKVVRWTVHILLILAILALVIFFLYPKITGNALFRGPIMPAPVDSTAGDEGEEGEILAPCICDCMSDEDPTVRFKGPSRVRSSVPEDICDAIEGKEPCDFNLLVDGERVFYQGTWENCDWDSPHARPEEPEKPKSGWEWFKQRMNPFKKDGRIRWTRWS